MEIDDLKADVEKSLPPKSETILFTGMSALQKRLYKDILLHFDNANPTDEAVSWAMGEEEAAARVEELQKQVAALHHAAADSTPSMLQQALVVKDTSSMTREEASEGGGSEMRAKGLPLASRGGLGW